MRPFLVVAVAALLLLSGCLGGAEKKDVTVDDAVKTTNPLAGPANGTAGQVTSADAPVWTKGWSWAVTLNETGRGELSFNLVVADDTTDYVVATDNADLAYRDALTEDLWFLGPMRKDDLAPIVGGLPVPFAAWPMEDGATWSTVDARGAAITWYAAYTAAVPLGDATYPGFSVSGTNANGTLVYEYAYVPEAQWFARFVVRDPEVDTGGDNTLLTLTTTAFGPAFGGDVVRLEATWLRKEAFSLPTQTTASLTFDVPAGLSKLYVYMELRSSNSWSGLNGYSNLTLLDAAKMPVMSHYRVMVLPYAFDPAGAALKGAVCGDPLRPVTCKWPAGDPWAPYHSNYTKFLDNPAAGAWSLAYVHGGTSELRTGFGAAGIVETVGKV